jgi:hypothetical protein
VRTDGNWIYLLLTWAKRDFLVQIANYLFFKLYGESYEEFSVAWFSS